MTSPKQVTDPGARAVTASARPERRTIRSTSASCRPARDSAATDPIAGQMVNFTYAVGDRTTGEALVVDPPTTLPGIVDALAADDMTAEGSPPHPLSPDHSAT